MTDKDGKIRCAKCGKTNLSDSRFCQYCGNPLYLQKDPDPVKKDNAPMKKCQACGTMNTGDSRFCKNCGKSLDSEQGSSSKRPSFPFKDRLTNLKKSFSSKSNLIWKTGREHDKPTEPPKGNNRARHTVPAVENYSDERTDPFTPTADNHNEYGYSRESFFDTIDEELRKLGMEPQGGNNYDANDTGLTPDNSEVDSMYNEAETVRRADAIEFDPLPVLGPETNAVNLLFRLLNNNDQSWLTQSTSTFTSMGCRSGNSYFAAVVDHVTPDEKEAIRKQEEALSQVGSMIANKIKKDYDLTYKDPGAVDGSGQITYKGWLLERLYRQEGTGKSAETLYLDYCLGADGETYMIAYDSSSGGADRNVFKCICFSPLFLSNPFANVYTAAISGVAGVFDAIPLNQADPRRNVQIRLDTNYYYNFPLQIDDSSAYPYNFLGGIIRRMFNLLDEETKDKCCEENEYFKEYLS